MGENSAIEWCHATFNPVWGCSKVSPACDHCYAETWAKRVGMANLWEGEHRIFGDAHWREPLKWNRQAAADGVRRRVFCASMADVFDKDWPSGVRERLWELIEDTPHLDWLLLTKRIGNAKRMFPERWGPTTPANVWLGATVVTQEEADRDIPKLLETEAAIRFLSIEPMLGPIDLTAIVHKCPFEGRTVDIILDALRPGKFFSSHEPLDWVICGGESGPRARPFVLGWGKEIVRQCREAAVACFVKQVGARPVNREGERCPHIRDPKGKIMEEWPEQLRVREFPDGR